VISALTRRADLGISIEESQCEKEATDMPEPIREQLIDPVCGMRMEPEEAPAVTSYEGRSYYFCSDTHKEEFERNPAYYAERVKVEETGER